jgi:Icc-related predicted phosphoesterase
MKRRELSKKRQEIAQQLSLWNQRVREIEYKIIANPGANDQETLRFCKAERDTCVQALKALNRSTYKQRLWASGPR